MKALAKIWFVLLVLMVAGMPMMAVSAHASVDAAQQAGDFGFDMIEFLMAGKENAAVVIFLVLVLTFLAGRLGAKGKVQLGISLGLGFVFGGAFQAAATGWPSNYEGWFWLVIYAMVMAVLPFLAYDLGKDLIEKSLRKSDVPVETAMMVGQALRNMPLGRDD